MSDRGPMTHDLKTWPEHYEAVLDFKKPFEVRKNDRDFRVGDLLRLREYDPERGAYTSHYLYRRVIYVLEGGKFGIEPGFVVMGLDIKSDIR